MPTPGPQHAGATPPPMEPLNPRRLARARKRVARIDHPGVDHAPAPGPGAPLDQASLAERLGTLGPLDLDATRALAHDVLAALAAVHAHGLVHGRLDATCVVQDAERWRVGGLAEAIAGARTGGRASIFGKPANEASGGGSSSFAGRGGVAPLLDEREDIRGVGILLYQALTGAPPFRISHEALPDALRPTIMRCLQQNPDRRHGSARELAAALGVPLPPEPPRRLGTRGKALVAVGVALVAALAGTVAWRHVVTRPALAPSLGARAPRAGRIVLALAARGRWGEPGSGRQATQARAVLAATLEATGTVDVLEWDPARPPEEAAAIGAQVVLTVGASSATRRGAEHHQLEIDLAGVENGARLLAIRVDAPAHPGALAAALAPVATQLGTALAIELVPPELDQAAAWDAFLDGLEAEAGTEPEAARLAHERAASLAPAFVAPRLRLVRLLAADGREAEAAAVARELLAIPGLPEEAALWAHAAGDATLAERRTALGVLVARRPADGALALEHATLARRLGDAAGCRAEAARAGALDPVKQGASGPSLGEASRASPLTTLAAEAGALGSRCALEGGDAAAAEALATDAGGLALGDLLLARGRYGAAREAYRRAGDAGASGAAARALLVDVHGTGRCRMALDSAARLAHKAEGRARATLAWSWGQAAVACGDWTQGREAADWARRSGLTSEADEIGLWLDASRGHRGAFERAKAWADRGRWTGVALERGRRFGALARAVRTPAEATQVLALAGEPAWVDRLAFDAPPLLIDLARLRAMTGDAATATTACEEVVTAAPAYVPALACRARAATARGDHEAASAALRELLDRYAGAEEENRVVRDARRDLRRAIGAIREQRAAAPAPAPVADDDPTALARAASGGRSESVQ